MSPNTFAIILATLGAATLFGGLVYAVLVAAHVSEPAATTVYGLTPQRLWATMIVVLALVGVVIGALALARPASLFGTASGRLGAVVALVAGLITVVNGGLNLAIANGGPGTGSGEMNKRRSTSFLQTSLSLNCESPDLRLSAARNRFFSMARSSSI